MIKSKRRIMFISKKLKQKSLKGLNSYAGSFKTLRIAIYV